MSVFVGQFNWDQGLIWHVGFIDGALTPDVAMAENKFHVCPVLVDTGASRTCIAKPVVDALGLQPFGKAEMQTASGLVSVNMYNVMCILVFATILDRILMVRSLPKQSLCPKH